MLARKGNNSLPQELSAALSSALAASLSVTPNLLAHAQSQEKTQAQPKANSAKANSRSLSKANSRSQSKAKTQAQPKANSRSPAPQSVVTSEDIYVEQNNTGPDCVFKFPTCDTAIAVIPDEKNCPPCLKKEGGKLRKASQNEECFKTKRKRKQKKKKTTLKRKQH